MIAFHPNPSRRECHGFRYSRYTTLDRRFAVERSVYPMANETAREKRLPTVWRALVRDEDGHWAIISRHRKRGAAVKAIERFSRR